ncbi:MAG: HlyD family efflux transporter periplasmic adaptor subunit [Clostridia bacterium]|nr:HlyD family efflux transporter periplasmic adaptor subunit [Clostridia bacterium]
MEIIKKKRVKQIIAVVCVAAIVAVLALMPILFGQNKKKNGPKASILSSTVETGQISKKLVGGGTISGEDAVSISVPASVKLTGYTVANGDEVKKGDAVASVDRVTVMTAISEVQKTLDLLASEIETESKKTSDESVAALAGGTVKKLYAGKGDSVQTVMLEHGALAVLSLDGLMAVDVTAESDLKAGSAVTLTFSDKSTAEGKVESNLSGKITVTVEDKGYSEGTAVQVSAKDGAALGSGELYIHMPWNATAYAGTVKSVGVKEGDTVKAGKSLMELTDSGYSGAYRQLVNQRQAYEDLMTELFEMYQTQTLTAPCDGVVSDLDEDGVLLTSAKKKSYTAVYLSNSPNGDDEAQYRNYIALVTGIGQDGWTLNVDPQSREITDYKELSGVSVSTDSMTEAETFDPNGDNAGVPVFELRGGAWTRIDASDIGTGDILLFACDGDGHFVWIVRVRKSETAPTVPEQSDTPETPSEPVGPAGSEMPTGAEIPDDAEMPTRPEKTDDSRMPTQPEKTDLPDTPTKPENTGEPETSSLPDSAKNTDPPSGKNGSADLPANPGTSFDFGSSAGQSASSSSGSAQNRGTGNGSGFSMPENSGAAGSFGGFSQDGAAQQEENELYGLDVTQIAAVTPQSAVTLDITVSELDVSLLRVGMTAEVQIDALGGEKITATVSEIGNTGTNNGGYSFFTVKLTMERSADMLSGMNASATIVTDTVGSVLTVPAAALAEDGTKTVIYTGYDKDNDVLTDPVEVTVGVSDGQTVEIIDGLDAGATIYYSYYDTLEVSFTPDFGGSGFGGFKGFSFGR